MLMMTGSGLTRSNNRSGIVSEERSTRPQEGVNRMRNIERDSLRRLAAIAVAFAVSVTASAQITTSIVGLVTDETGAVLPGAIIRLEPVDGPTRTALAGPEGRYEFQNVPEGVYQVRADLTGFIAATRQVTAAPNQALTINFVLRERPLQKANPPPPPPPAPPAPAPPAGAPLGKAKAGPSLYWSVSVLYATDRMRAADAAYGAAYSRERAVGSEEEAMQYGRAVVTIPRSHHTGELETPSLFHLEFTADPAKHVILARSEPLDRAVFFSDLRRAADGQELLLFIHGYNVTFENALRRTAQLAHDLRFAGPAVAYTWPGQDNAARYLIAESNVDWCKPHLMRFLNELAERSGATRIHVIVHSLGNRIFAHAVDTLVATHPGDKALFHNVVMAAADIDVDEFRELAQNMRQSTDHLTLYVSSTDKALQASMKLAKYARVGQAGAQVMLLAGIDTIDATDVDKGFFWDVDHSYFGDSRSVLGDLWELVGCDWKVADRDAMRADGSGDPKLWRLLANAPRRQECGSPRP